MCAQHTQRLIHNVIIMMKSESIACPCTDVIVPPDMPTFDIPNDQVENLQTFEVEREETTDSMFGSRSDDGTCSESNTGIIYSSIGTARNMMVTR